MRRTTALLLTVSTLTLGGATLAQAADMAVKARPGPVALPVAYNWTGIYVGAHVGAIWGDKNWVEILGPTPGGQISPDYSGFLGGGQIGFNYQVSSFVFGIEGEWSWTNAEGTSGCITVPALGCNVEVDWVGSVSGRLGYAFGPALLYVKGGWAWVSETYFAGVGGVAPITIDHDRDGWLLGVGVEYGFAPNWSAKLEYNYIDFGTDQITFAPGLVQEIGQDAHLVKFGVNYRFGWGGPVVARY
jgi:outer membrane immunogenic protein